MLLILKNFLKIILIGVTIDLTSMYFIRLEIIFLMFYISAIQEKIPPSEVIYMRSTGAYGIENYKLMATFKEWLKENDLYNEDTVIYAIPMDNPEIVPPCQCRYDVCITKPETATLAFNQVECRNLESGTYLVFLLSHTTDAVQTAWEMCFSELEKLGHLLDKSRPVIERYKKSLVDRHLCELCVPIQ